ncbi:hypothetical protein [Mycobacterium simiae]|uniref:hypothetical protein n=1 Tax=Mycobacterium simiae TaxID=1784 RepID=UPI00165F9A93|nr:hypothetical protein [Mycobacterium simiae]
MADERSALREFMAYHQIAYFVVSYDQRRRTCNGCEIRAEYSHWLHARRVIAGT